jgi:hypothetical protein
MQSIASKHVFRYTAVCALFVASMSVNPAIANTSESGGFFMSGGSSEGGGRYASGAENEGAGVYGGDSVQEGGGIYNTGSTSESGGNRNSGSSTEGGGFENSGSSTESGIGFVSYVPPNPHAWSTYEGPKAPPAWGAPTMSGSGGMANAGSEAEANGSSAIAQSPDVDVAADRAKYVHYYGH